MAGENPEVKIKISSDTKGGEKATKSLDDVKKASGGVMGAMDRMKSSVEKARGALMSLGGVGAIITGAVHAFKAWREAASETAAEIDKVNVDFVTKQIREMSDAERKANAEISRGNQLRMEAYSSDEKRLQTARRIEDATRREAKARELSSVKDGPDAEIKRAEIERRYAAQQGESGLTREREDAIRKIEQLRESARIENENAASKEAFSADMGDLARSEMKVASRRAVYAAKKQRGFGWWNALVGNTAQGEFASEASSMHRAAGETAQNASDKAADEARASRDRAKALEREARDLEDSLKAIAADVRATRAEDAQASGDLNSRWNKSRRERAREASELSGNRSEKVSVERQIEVARGRLSQIQAERRGNDLRAARAGDAYDAAVAGGASRRDQRAAYDARQATLRQVENANFNLDQAEARIQASLEALNARLRKLSIAVEQGEKRASSRDAN